MVYDPYSKPEVEVKFTEKDALYIAAEKDPTENTLLELPDQSALDNGEEVVQLMEGCGYEYELPKEYRFDLDAVSGVVSPSRRHPNRGRLTPGIYVGRLELTARNKISGETYSIPLEVRSIKSNYRDEYRKMLEDITVECTELLMLHSSPATQRYTVDYEVDSKTLYQRFAFVKSIADSDEFRNAVHRIIAMPVTAWRHTYEERDIRRCRRVGGAQLRQMASRSDRVNLPAGHTLQKHFSSIPARLETAVKFDTVDTPENRFVKQTLKEFERFCGEVCQVIRVKFKDSKKLPQIYQEARQLEKKFAAYLNHTIFREVESAASLPLNSPILQRKEGYREILKAWLKYDLAAKMVWKGMDDETYQAGKRDVATLYEYWLFFKLLRLVERIFKFPKRATSELIKPTADGLCLQLKSGKPTAMDGIFHHKGREMKIRYSYNRTFGRSDYPKSGSWTLQMRPDYTLSIWPAAFKAEEAEEQEAMVHIHFDAKYKVAGLEYLEKGNASNEDSDTHLNDEKIQQKKGIYKAADLLKMHAYKDAIRRTVGAYVLYPGTISHRKQGFHEVVPGLGAFPVSPSNDGDGLQAVEIFIQEVVEHFCDRSSQRESLSYETYQIHKEKIEDRLHDATFPEKYRGIRSAPPQNITVLVGYYQDKQKAWIEGKGRYNIPITKKEGLEKYSSAETGAKYLLLHGKGELETGQLWSVISETPALQTKEDLIADGYPNPSKALYFVYSIEKAEIPEFKDVKWDIRKLKETKGYGYTTPFAISLKQLMRGKSS